MAQQLNVNILAQTGDDDPVSEGMTGNGPNIVAIDNQYSLFGLAEDKANATGKTARLALEVLLDDVQTNLGSREYEQATDYEKHVLGTRCIEESFENINDYLISQDFIESSDSTHQGVAMTVMQIINGQCSFIHAAEHCCLHYRDGKLSNLSHSPGSKEGAKSILGINEILHIKTNQISLIVQDMLLTCNQQLLHYVSEEFLRITLARFQDSPQMAMRQINSKAFRGGMQDKPLLVLTSVNAVAERNKSWFKR